MIYERALAEQKRIETELKKLQAKLKTYPKGKLICTHSGKYPKYYVSDGHSKKYIKQKQLPLAEELAAKRYISALIEDYTHELTAINQYLNHHQNHATTADKIISASSPYHKLLTPYLKPLSQELNEWMNSDYEKNTSHPENLIHTGSSGTLVRSKAESMIDSLLHEHQIPFRYECKLDLGDITYYPDFTIRHPVTGQTYYWEHFGKMNDPMYRNTTCSKLNTYIQHNIIPSINLITTYEIPGHPLTRDFIDFTIKRYFL